MATLAVVGGASWNVASALGEAPQVDGDVPQVNRDDWTSSAICGECHQAIHAVWSQSLHSKSWTNGVFQAASQRTLDKYGSGEAKTCMNCHTPTVRFTKDYGAKKPITSEGITCDFCHSVNAIDLNDRANPIRYVAGRDKYGPLRHAQSPAQNVVHSPVHRTSEFCGGCHEYKNARGMTILGTCPEWKAGPYAQREAALLQKELAQGTHRDIRKVTWWGFVAEQVRSAGKRNALEARRTLTEFGGMSGRTLRAVRFATIEAYVGRLHEGGNSQSTINKKLRYLRAAFNRAVKRQYIGANPMDGWQW